MILLYDLWRELQGPLDYFNNLTHGQHHIGINPGTGEIWYQEAAGYNNFSKDGPSTYYENPNGPGFTPNTPNAPSSGGSTGGSTGGCVGHAQRSGL